jgi:ABC-type multidrug transport system fused ATPase/permease subunit
MRALPVADPGTPDLRSAAHYLWWLVRQERRTVAQGMFWGMTWMVSLALMPAVVGAAIQRGVAEGDTGELLTWAGALFGLGVVQALAGIMRHRNVVQNFLAAAYRTVQFTVRHAGRLGGSLERRIAASEVISVGTTDISHIGMALDITGRLAGAVVSVVVIAVVLLHASVPLGLTVVLGVPALLAIVTTLIRPLHARQQAYRSLTGALTGRAADIVTGLRVLRGIGGEAAFAQRYREQSQQVRRSGVRVAEVQSWLEAAQVLLPGLFVVLVVWLGARFALDGKIDVGQLITFYGYAAFLMLPLKTLTEAADKVTRAHVAAGRVVRFLTATPDLAEPAVPAAAPATPRLSDPDSGFVAEPGRLTALVCARPDDATAIVARVGLAVESEARLGGTRLADLDRATLRTLVLVADNDAQLLSGRLREELGGTQAELDEALWAASAQDIVDALPDGVDAEVAERGREFSGGQQQRLRLARALLADPPVLVLVEPTSAVDAHTEARIADRLRRARDGRTTVLVTTSPLLLDRADQVCFVEEGRRVAQGTHHELLRENDAYASTVTRGEEDR